MMQRPIYRRLLVNGEAKCSPRRWQDAIACLEADFQGAKRRTLGAWLAY
jgi:hypothetical protein